MTVTKTDEFRAKRRLLQIDNIPLSQLPHRVSKRRTGVVLGSFGTPEEVDQFIDRLSLEELQRKPQRKRLSQR